MDDFTLIGNNKYKLSYGNRNNESYESILETSKDIEEFDIFVELNNDDDVQKLKKLFQQKGSNVKSLTWSNWCKYSMSASEVVEMVNSLPNLEFLGFSSWYTEFTGGATSGSITLPNLSSIVINECKNFIFDFLTTAIPDNKLNSLKIHNVSEVDAKFNSLIKKHPSIKRLDISNGDYNTLDSLKELKLESLRCILIERSGDTDKQRAFLKELIKSQTELTSLDVLNDMDYAFNFVDDGIFQDICALSKLEALLISVDGISANAVKSISNLTSLKSVELKTNRDSSLNFFQEFSLFKNSSIEKMVFKLWSFEIPAETYSAFGSNFESLKSLRITLGTKHKINFYVTAFPNLEELNVRFGESNDPVEFSQAYDSSDVVKNSTLKKLKLSFWGAELINVDEFFNFLQIFENLESLEIHTKFPFKADFVNQLADKLNTIKSLKFTSFSVCNEETFPSEIVDAFKSLRSKLNYAHFTFSNIQSIDFGSGPMPGEQGVNQAFTFKPFIIALKDVYKAQECGLSNIRIHNTLVLTAGHED